MLRHTRRNAEVGNVSHGDRRCGVFPITTFRRLIGPITLTFYSLTIRETDTFFFIVPVLHPLISLYFATKVSQKLDPVAAETKWFGVFRFASKWFLGVFCVLVGEGDMTRHEPRDDTGYGVPSGSHKGYPANSHSARDTAHLFVLAIVIFVLYAVNFHAQVRISRSTHSASLITALCGVRNSYCRTQSTTATVTPTHSVGPRTNPGYTSRPTQDSRLTFSVCASYQLSRLPRLRLHGHQGTPLHADLVPGEEAVRKRVTLHGLPHVHLEELLRSGFHAPGGVRQSAVGEDGERQNRDAGVNVIAEAKRGAG